MRGKTSRSAEPSPSSAACFNEAPLLCGERRNSAACWTQGNGRFNEAPLLCGERPREPERPRSDHLVASMRPRFYAGKDDLLDDAVQRVCGASMRPRFYAGKDRPLHPFYGVAQSASMRPRFYAGKDVPSSSGMRPLRMLQ